MNKELDVILEVPEEDSRDKIEKFAKGMLSLLPAGSLAFDLYSRVCEPSLEIRRNKWMETVSSLLQELNTFNENIVESLKGNEEFISLFLTITQLALKTHIEEKIELFKNSLKNGIKESFDYYTKNRCVKLLDELNTYQIKILKMLIINQEKYINFSDCTTLYLAINDKTRNDRYDFSEVISLNFILKDLDRKGLVIIGDKLNSPPGVVARTTSLETEEGDMNPEYYITSFGYDFINMISDKRYKRPKKKTFFDM